MTKLTSLKLYLIFAGCCIAGASKFLGLEIPIRVKCWFCPHKQTVKFSQRNSWDCQSCSQYNGFNKDGDYNKEISGQHSEIPVYPKVNYRFSHSYAKLNGFFWLELYHIIICCLQ
mgnify:CR=1 FL=1